MGLKWRQIGVSVCVFTYEVCMFAYICVCVCEHSIITNGNNKCLSFIYVYGTCRLWKSLKYLWLVNKI